MTEQHFDIRPLYFTQQVAWYCTLIIFALSAIVYMLSPSVARIMAEGGLLFVLVATLGKLIVLSDQFRKHRLNKYLFLSAALIIVLAVTILVRLLQ